MLAPLCTRHPSAGRSRSRASPFAIAFLALAGSAVAGSFGCLGAERAAPPDPAPYAIVDDGGAGFVVDLPAFDASWTLSGMAPDTSVVVDPPEAVPDAATPIDPPTATTDAGEASDAGETNAPGDSSLGNGCTAPPGPGDLAIDEIMITSVAGSGDDGEWIEVRSTRSCSLNLEGLHGECPNGANVRTFDVGSTMTLPPFGTFVVADSSDPAVNHDLPGQLLVWAGHTGDVLRKDGATITLTMSGAIVDSVTYPSLKLAVGQSLAFPSDCGAAARTDWTEWQPSVASWFPAFLGTPNAPNDDVHCPYRPPGSTQEAGGPLGADANEGDD
jgi:hypothetical protein